MSIGGEDNQENDRQFTHLSSQSLRKIAVIEVPPAALFRPSHPDDQESAWAGTIMAMALKGIRYNDLPSRIER